ncbi:hypothetical protein BDN72DRAFT_447822 [Pluteus cervinus]|uniref:Uncharacterized protein n=1 Tax=Pluteus cervinus TaxID=181527 RepID=A0ACD3BCQ4_9AGAR|nr:hypothetical protein BDN72DRAFT_447822 [Pluteus cervinus]
MILLIGYSRGAGSKDNYTRSSSDETEGAQSLPEHSKVGSLVSCCSMFNVQRRGQREEPSLVAQVVESDWLVFMGYMAFRQSAKCSTIVAFCCKPNPR